MGSAKVISFMRKKKGIPGHDYSKGFKSDDLPATQGFVEAVRIELSSKITSLELVMKGKFSEVDGRFSHLDSRFADIDARFAQIDARFAQIDARFDQIDAQFAQVDARFDRLEAKFDEKFEKMMVILAQMHANNEKQRNENRIVLDTLSWILEDNDKIKKRLDTLEGM